MQANQSSSATNHSSDAEHTSRASNQATADLPPHPPSSSPIPLPLVHTIVPQPDENEPDPFYREIEYKPPTSVSSAHPSSPGRILLLLVTWAHAQWNAPLRFCAAMLAICTIMLRSAGVNISRSDGSHIPLTYKTLEKRLSTEPKFDALPVCPKCLEPHPITHTGPLCTMCSSPMFTPTGERKPSASADATNGKPSLKFPYKSITEHLTELLSMDGVADMMDDWRTSPRKAGVLGDIFDGNIAKSVKGVDGQPFFRNEPLDRKGPDGELRIGLTFGMDW